MDLLDIYTVFIFLGLGILVTIAAIIWRGMWWISVFGGLLWILFGFYCMGATGTHLVFSFQRELAIVFIVIGLGVLFSPVWYKKKETKTGAETLEEDDVTAYKRELKEYEDGINQYRGLGRKRRPL